ncbi:hypothetical protein [Clostridium faecium]|uniref:CopG family transcriptional regulator n=1 Tax=Clostridium faecium TaxID=2762223 RepID=A0ABR8YNJ7_9CLOT|nr:hypothetical protein [Clostridium faecium]MBD8045824.1 hypothetical protein [Clostridium faecium]
MEGDKLILEQVAFVNNKLKEGISIAQVERDLNLGKDTLRKQLNRAGYFLNKKEKQFELKNIKEQSNNKGIVKKNKSDNKNNGRTIDELNNKIKMLEIDFNKKIEGIINEVYSNKEKLQELLNMKDTNLNIRNNNGIIINEVINMDKSNRKKATFNIDLSLLEKLNECEGKNISKNISKSDIVNVAIKKYLKELGIIKE